MPLPRSIVRVFSVGLAILGAEVVCGQDTLFDLGIEPVGSSPQELAALMKSDIPRLGKVIKDAGIREQP